MYMSKEITCRRCKFHYEKNSLLDFVDADHRCKHPANCWTTQYDKVENKSAIYGIKSSIHHGSCMECNKDNNCKHYKPNLIQIIADWFVYER